MRVIETRINFDINDYVNQKKNDKEFNNFVKTKSTDLPPEYIFMINEVYKNKIKERTLDDLILLSYEQLGEENNFFLKSGEKITGWMAYTIDKYKGYVNNLKMCSLIKSNNMLLIKDLKDFINYLLSKYEMVCWEALKDNPTNKIYEKCIKMYNGSRKELDTNTWYYIIPKKG